MELRICKVCHIEKPLEQFPPLGKKGNGYEHTCRVCRAFHVRVYRATHIEQDRARSAAYAVNHREQARARSTAYYAAHKEQGRMSRAAYRVTHKEQTQARAAAYRAAHQKELRAYFAAYHVAHIEKAHSHRAARRARKAAAPLNDLTAAQWREIQVAYHYRCAYCGKKSKQLTQDHILALSNNGSHTVHNIVPACQSCNSKKGKKAPLVAVQPLLLTVAASKKIRS